MNPREGKLRTCPTYLARSRRSEDRGGKSRESTCGADIIFDGKLQTASRIRLAFHSAASPLFFRSCRPLHLTRVAVAPCSWTISLSNTPIPPLYLLLYSMSLTTQQCLPRRQPQLSVLAVLAYPQMPPQTSLPARISHHIYPTRLAWVARLPRPSNFSRKLQAGTMMNIQTLLRTSTSRQPSRMLPSPTPKLSFSLSSGQTGPIGKP